MRNSNIKTTFVARPETKRSPAFAWLHKIRGAMRRSGRGKLEGTVEVDET